MKYFFTAMLLMTVCFAKAQIVNIPDANFKATLISLGIDANNDGEIQQAEANALIDLEILNNQGITDLSGINSFINLHIINLSQNNVSVLDVTGLTQLQ